MQDETLLRTVQNGLVIAGHEMGAVGDYWPALNAISKGVENEFEVMRRNEAVNGELEIHLANAIREYEDLAATLKGEDKRILTDYVKELWARYYAIYEPLAPSLQKSVSAALVESHTEMFPHMRAALGVIKSLGGKI